MSKNSKGAESVVPAEIIDPLSRASREVERNKRRQAIESLNSLLPPASKRDLAPLLNRWHQDEAGLLGLANPEPTESELELFSEIRRSLNEATIQGSLGRREFLKIAGLIMTSGLGAMIFPQSADAMYNMGAFWKKKKAAASGSTNNGGVSATPSTNLWGSSSLDPYWDYVTLLMNFDGSNGATTFADESNTGKTPTINGTPYIDTAATPFSGGKGSARLTAATDYITYADSADFQFGTGDFTIEGWIYPTSTTSGVIIAKGGQGAYLEAFRLHLESGNLKTYASSSNSSYDILNNVTIGAIAANQWTHVALVRSGTSFKGYINGVGTSLTTSSVSLNNNGCFIGIGASTSTSTCVASYSGFLADLRVYKGFAKYSANFTKPSSPIGLGSTKDPYWSYCVLACPFENSLKDMSGKRFAAAGAAALDSGIKKFGSTSGSFNGSSSYLTTASDSSLAFGTADFTVESWIYLSTTPSGGQTILDSSGSGQFGFSVSNTTVSCFASNVASYNISYAPTATSWYHLAIVRQSGVIYLYINGALQGSVACTYDFSSSGTLTVGAHNNHSSYFFNGRLDSFRITKGYARYTSSFTVPTASYPVGKDETTDPFWTYTVLAMHMDDFTDSTSRHALAAYGNASMSTAQAKYGGKSAAFDGNGDYLSTPDSSDWSFGSANFTIEFFVRLNSMVEHSLLSQVQDSSNYWFLNFHLTSGPTFNNKENGTANAVINQGSLAGWTAGQWYHLALVRNGNTLTFYRDGIQLASATTSASLADFNAPLTIGQTNNTFPDFNGYIDDLRITKGVARYTQNFTPPTAAFATTAVASTQDYDPFWSNVVFHLSGQGTNGATPSTDSVGNSLTWSGGAAISTSQSKWYGSSYHGSAATDCGYAASSTAFDFGAGSFDLTVEAWVYISTFTGAPILVSRGNWGSGGGSGFDFGFNYGDGRLAVAAGDGNSPYLDVHSGTSVVPTNTWTHVAAVKKGGSILFFINGNLVSTTVNGSYSNYTTANFSKTGAVLSFGGERYNSTNSNGVNGYINDLRITSGLARYQGNFVPPTSALPTTASISSSTVTTIVKSGLVANLDAGDVASYPGGGQTWRNLVANSTDDPYYSNVLLLMHMEGTNGSTTIVESAKSRSVAVVGNAQLATAQSKFGSSSLSMNRTSGSGVTIASASDFVFAGDFTIELWVRFNSISGQILISTLTGTDGWEIEVSSITLYFNNRSVGTKTFSWSPAANTWYHLAVAREGSNLRLFINGTQQGATATLSGTLTSSGSSYVRLGTRQGLTGYEFDGYMDEVRVTNGVARYTSNFTAPTACFPDTGRGAYDFKFGDGSTSSTFPTFNGVAGGRSANDYLSFDGSDYLTLSGSNTTFINSFHSAAGAYTFEIWATLVNNGNYQYIFWTSGDSTVGAHLRLNTSGQLEFTRSNGSAIVTKTNSYSAFQMPAMIAVTIDNSTGAGSFYVNGTQSSFTSSYTGTSSSTPNNLVLFANNAGSYQLASGSKVYAIRMYNRVLSKTELDQNFNALRSRYGL